MYDRKETKRRGYSGKSKVYFDGRERLYGKDWEKRKREVWERGHHRCEQWIETWPDIRISLKCKVLCHNDMHDPHHIVKRSKKRDDRLSNLIGLCRMHHDLLDKRKPMWSKDAGDSRVSKELA